MNFTRRSKEYVYFEYAKDVLSSFTTETNCECLQKLARGIVQLSSKRNSFVQLQTNIVNIVVLNCIIKEKNLFGNFEIHLSTVSVCFSVRQSYIRMTRANDENVRKILPMSSLFPPNVPKNIREQMFVDIVYYKLINKINNNDANNSVICS